MANIEARVIDLAFAGPVNIQCRTGNVEARSFPLMVYTSTFIIHYSVFCGSSQTPSANDTVFGFRTHRPKESRL
jgi:hypothetical protein